MTRTRNLKIDYGKGEEIVFDVDIDEEGVEDYEDTPANLSVLPGKSVQSTSPFSSSPRHVSSSLSNIARAKKMLKFDFASLNNVETRPLAGLFMSASILLISIATEGGPTGGGYFVYGIFLTIVAMVATIVLALEMVRPTREEEFTEEELQEGEEETASSTRPRNGSRDEEQLKDIELSLSQQNGQEQALQMEKHRQRQQQQTDDGNQQSDTQHIHFLSYFLFVWNLIGACVMTFGNGPFIDTSNGYFSAWGMAAFAGFQTFEKAVAVVSSTDKHIIPRSVHMISSHFVILALSSSTGGGSSFLNTDSSFRGIAIYGLILACVSLVVMMCTALPSDERNKGNRLFLVMTVLAVQWVVSACILTFKGPFLTTGNGYFGAWGGAFTAIYIAISVKEPSK